MTTIYVLGAADPEMQAIEKLLTDAGKLVVYAADQTGKRVHPGSAYKATGYLDGAGHSVVTLGYNLVVLVECGFMKGHPWAELGKSPVWMDSQCGLILNPGNECEFMGHMEVIRCDHHNPGDPGYGKGPEEFLSASSIGQVYRLLNTDWGLEFLPSCQEWRGKKYPEWVIPSEIVLCAAADHCLPHAYRGECPGVDPDTLMKWRVASRAAFQKRPVEEILADVYRARLALREAVSPICHMCDGTGRSAYNEPCCMTCGGSGQGCDREYANLIGVHVPELPEAAAREGIPFLSQVKDRDGREKIVLMSAGPELIQKFLDGKVVEKLVDVYGDPARGFAGGYLP